MNGSAFAVLGYPRSGTTMLSEITAMVTDYYFDRDNIFPSSSKVILHTHWDPRFFLPERSIYIVRAPFDVCMSVFEYSNVRGWALPIEQALTARRICRIPWGEHVQAALRAGHAIIDYDRLVAKNNAEIDRLAAQLAAPPGWVASSIDLLAAKHAARPHASDVESAALKAQRTTPRVEALRDQLRHIISDEERLYQDVTARV